MPRGRPIGDGITYDGPLNSLGVMAIGPEQEEPVTVEFDYFHLDTEEEPPADTTAPSTTITWQPATADGEQGWYVTAPSFTLDAEDDGSVASTEYRIDDGAWTAYADAVQVSDGTHTVEYRSTDEAGNVEDVQSSQVKVDTVTPATGVEQKEADNGVRVVLSPTDATSGVAATEYQVDGGSWTTTPPRSW